MQNRPAKAKLTAPQKRATHTSLVVFLLFVVASIIFFGLAKEVRDNETMNFDNAVLLWIYQFHSDGLTKFFRVITELGGIIVVPIAAALIAALLWLRDKRDKALRFALGVGGASVAIVVLKNFFGRTRPDLWERVITETSFSFPSGHAIASLALAGSLMLIFWKTKWWLTSVILGITYVLLVGLSRLYFGVHYPTDILAGWAVAIAWLMIVTSIFKYEYRRDVARARQDPAKQKTK